MSAQKDLAIDFASRHFKDNLECVLLSGSSFFGEPREHSDIDLLVICKSILQPKIWSIHENGIHFDCKVYDSETLFFELNRQQNQSYYRLMLHLVGMSVIIPTDNSVGLYFQALARRYMAEGPNVSAKHLESLTYRIGNLLNDIRDRNSEEQLYSLAVDAFSILREFLSLSNQTHINFGHWFPSLARERFPEQFEPFMRAFRAFFKESNKAPLIEYLQMVLDNARYSFQAEYTLEYPAHWRQKL